jgi:hypothetical protein
MLFRIGTHYFDFNRAYLRKVRDTNPSIAGDLKWID